MELGFDLSQFEVDSIYGNETGHAVTAYKQSNGIQRSDGVVGQKTIAALDADFADLVVPPSSCADESPSGRRSRSGSRSKEADPTNLRVWTWASVRSLVLTKTRFEDNYGACIGFF